MGRCMIYTLDFQPSLCFGENRWALVGKYIRSALCACAATVTILLHLHLQNLLVVPRLRRGSLSLRCATLRTAVRFQLITPNRNKKYHQTMVFFISGGSGRNRTDTPFGT